jgi:hypothetical protein
MPEEKNIYQKIGDAVVDFAPGIAGILAATGVGAPVAAAVGALSALGRAFGLGSSAKPEEVLSVISVDPEIRLKAMIAENDFKAEMGRQDLEKIKAVLADVQSARVMKIETTKTNGKGDFIGGLLDLVIVSGFFVTLLGYMFVDIPVGQEGNVGLLVGALIGAFTTVISFYRGTSLGSVKKTEDAAATTRELAKNATK